MIKKTQNFHKRKIKKIEDVYWNAVDVFCVFLIFVEFLVIFEICTCIARAKGIQMSFHRIYIYLDFILQINKIGKAKILTNPEQTSFNFTCIQPFVWVTDVGSSSSLIQHQKIRILSHFSSWKTHTGKSNQRHPLCTKNEHFVPKNNFIFLFPATNKKVLNVNTSSSF